MNAPHAQPAETAGDVMTIRPIETDYAGHRFRSRLEARWAVFFNSLGVEWQYEVEGFEFDTERYLPDFYLPNSNAYVEVKGGDVALAEDLPRLRRFSRHVKPAIVAVLGDIPPEGVKDACWVHTGAWHGHLGLCLPVGHTSGSYSFAFMPAGNPTTTKPFALQGLTSWPEVKEAYRAARRARFEFGEHG